MSIQSRPHCNWTALTHDYPEYFLIYYLAKLDGQVPTINTADAVARFGLKKQQRHTVIYLACMAASLFWDRTLCSSALCDNLSKCLYL
jgi:hypothetical protein